MQYEDCMIVFIGRAANQNKAVGLMAQLSPQ